MNFILDDDWTRIDVFKLQRADVHVATTAAEAIDTLRIIGPFDLVSLDHDLHLHHYANYERDQRFGHDDTKCEDGGCAVARCLVSLPIDQRPRSIVLHSWNKAASKAMARILAQGGMKAKLQRFGKQ